MVRKNRNKIRKAITLILVTMLVTTISCKKDKEEIVTGKNNQSVAQKMMIPENVYTYSVSVTAFTSAAVQSSMIATLNNSNVFGIFSLNEVNANIKYGFVTNTSNVAVFNYLFQQSQEIQNPNRQVFDNLEEALNLVNVTTLSNVNYIAISKSEDGRWIVTSEQQQATFTITIPNFVIVTAAEMQYLSDPEPIDEFRVNVSSYIDMAVDKMNCYFVLHVNDDGTVQNQVIGKNSTTYSSWCNRLHGYFEIARYFPIIDIVDGGDPPPLDGACVTVKNKRNAKKLVDILLDDPDVKNICITKYDDGTYNVCWEEK